MGVHRSGRYCLLVASLVAFAGHCDGGQIAVPPAAQSQTDAPTPPSDPRGRTTPQSTMLEFIKYAQLGDYDSAAKYLEPPTAKQNYDPDETAKRLIALINTSFRGPIATVSNKPEGSVLDSNDPNVEIVGYFGSAISKRRFCCIKSFGKT